MKMATGCCRLLLSAGVSCAAFLSQGAVFDVREYGAKGDGLSKDTKAIQAAVDAANAKGGGTVELSAGTYLTGSIRLKDRVDFHLAEGAVLKGSPAAADYCSADCVPQNWASPRNGDNTSGGHLLWAANAKGITVRGPGKIDGNGPAFLLNEKGEQWPNWKKGIPFRPGQMVWFVDCEDVRISDVELAHSPYWTCNLLNCERVWIRGCYIHNERRRFSTWNGDGIDIDRCRYVHISDCRIDTTDDSITLRASCGKKLAAPKDCAFVTVQNCTLSSSCQAVRIGVGEGSIHDAVFSNLVISDSNWAFNFVGAYSPNNRGTDISGIRISNVRVEAQQFVMMHHKHSKEAVFSDIVFSDISGVVVKPSSIEAVADKPFRGILFRNVDIPKGVTVKNADVRFEGGTFAMAHWTTENVSENSKCQ